MHWSLQYPLGYTATWLAILMIAMVVAASFVLVWRQLWPLRAATVTLIVLRLVGLGLVVFLMLQPSVVFTKTDLTKPHVAVLLDTSGSMSMVDKDQSSDRLGLALRALESSKLLNRLGEKSQLSVYQFATDLSKLDIDRLDQLKKAAGTGTSIGLALTHIEDQFKGEELAGVIIFSDGRDNTGIDPKHAAIALEAPLYTVGFGRAKPQEQKQAERDLAVTDVAHNQRVIVGHTVDVTVTVRSKGFGARTVPVELVLDDRVVAAGTVALSPDRPERQVTMQLKPDKPGQVVYFARVPVDSAEVNKDNNQKPVPIVVIDPVARVLYVEARPRWEFKFLSRVLSAYKNVNHTSIVRMGRDRVIIQGSHPAESVQIATMTPTQLNRLKAIIIGDVPSVFFTAEQLSTIANMVEQGASLMLLAGKANLGPDGFGGTVLAPLLPFDLADSMPYSERRFRVRLTRQGAAHPAFQQIDHDWIQAPPLLSLIPVGQLKPGATALLEAADGSDLPVVVAHHYGKGKVIVVLTDSIWRWKLGMAQAGLESDLHAVFWQQLIAWMMPTQSTQKEKRAVQLVSDKLLYELNDQVKLTITAMDAQGRSTSSANVMCRIYAPDGKVLERKALFAQAGDDLETQAGGYVATFTTHVGGKYKIVATAASGGTDLGRDEISILVGDTSIEMTETDPDRDLLKTLAKITQGEYYEPEAAARIADDLAIFIKSKTKKSEWTTTKDLWDRWWVLLCFVAVLTGEWVMRRRVQLE